MTRLLEDYRATLPASEPVREHCRHHPSETAVYVEVPVLCFVDVVDSAVWVAGWTCARCWAEGPPPPEQRAMRDTLPHWNDPTSEAA